MKILLAALTFALFLTALPGTIVPVSHAADPAPARVDCDEISRQCTAHCMFEPDPTRCYDACMRFYGC